MESAIELSIIICTRNRGDRLGGTLSALAAIRSSASWEVLMVDNASTDDTAQRLAAADNCGGRLRIERCDRIGLGAARDTAWRLARGSIIAFTDDDCYPAPDFVDQMIAAFKRHTDAGCIGGGILLFDQADAPITIDERTDVRVTKPYCFVAAGQLQGANLAFRRTVLEEIGGVDVDFGAGTPFPCEDVDAVAATLWAGWSAVFDPGPAVWHHHGRKAEDIPALMAGYDRGRGAYYAKWLANPRARKTYLHSWIVRAALKSQKDELPRFRRECRSALAYLRHRQRYGLLIGLSIFTAGAIFLVHVRSIFRQPKTE